MIAIISLVVLALTLTARPLLADLAGYSVAGLLTMCGGAVAMHAAWYGYGSNSPFAPVWFAILTAGSLGLIGWAAPGILADYGRVPLGVGLPQVLFLFGIVPVSVSGTPILRWIWDRNHHM